MEFLVELIGVRSLLTRVKINNDKFELIPGSLFEVNLNYNEKKFFMYS